MRSTSVRAQLFTVPRTFVAAMLRIELMSFSLRYRLHPRSRWGRHRRLVAKANLDPRLLRRARHNRLRRLPEQLHLATEHPLWQSLPHRRGLRPPQRFSECLVRCLFLSRFASRSFFKVCTGVSRTLRLIFAALRSSHQVRFKALCSRYRSSLVHAGFMTSNTVSLCSVWSFRETEAPR